MKKIIVLTLALVFAAVLVTPANAARTIRGNGSNSRNRINMASLDLTAVVQGNQANVANAVMVDSDTGGNRANANTGAGEETVKSGNSNTTVNVVNDLNVNDAVVVGCGCEEDEAVVVAENGNNSVNAVNELDVDAELELQGNESNVLNLFAARSRTGRNRASRNTGPGAESVTSGSSSTTYGLTTIANYNYSVVR